MRAIYVILIGLVLFSCEDKIDIDNPEGQLRYTVEGEITTQLKKHQIKVTTTADFDSDDIPVVENAVVKLFDSEGNVFEYSYVGDGVYETDQAFSGKVGNFYSIEVLVGNDKLLKSFPEELTFITDIDSLFAIHVSEYEYVDGPPRDIDDSDTGYYVFLNATEKSTEGDGYRWKVFINGEILNGPEQFYYVSDDFFVDGQSVDSINFNFLAGLGDTVLYEQTSISLRNVDYLFSLETEANPDGFFGTPPAPVIGNMYNPEDEDEIVLGYFSASDVDTASIVITGDKK